MGVGVEIREATPSDADAIVRIRRLANENRLAFALTPEMVARALSRHCKAFLLISDNDEVVGFSMADKAGRSIWGLFIWEPYQGKGYGKLLLGVALAWLFRQRSGWLLRRVRQVNLTTEPQSDAASFYTGQGWVDQGVDEKGYQCFTLSWQDYQQALARHKPKSERETNPNLN